MATIKDFFTKSGVQATTTGTIGVGSANYIQAAGAASGFAVSLTALGTDANIGVNVVTKGTGTFTVNGSPIGVPGGSNGQIQYNNAGAFGGIATTGSANVVLSTSAVMTTPSITGGSIVALTALAVRNAGTGAFDLTFAHNGTLTAGRTLTVNVNDAPRALTLGGDIVTAGAFTMSGAFAVTLTSTATTSVTLPTSGTLATLANTETFTNKTLTTPVINGATVGVAATVTAGTNAQGQGPLSSDFNIVTTAAANPSGITLLSATSGRSVIVVNRGANPINVFPATGSTIDTLGVNTAISIPINGWMQFTASSTTQWYSSFNEIVSGSAIVGNISGAAASLSPGNTINGTTFTGASPITVTANTTNALTVNNSGTGAASGTTFNGSGAVTVSYNTVGAPSTTGTNASGTWSIAITGNAGSSTLAATTNDVASATTFFPTFVTANTGNNAITVSSTKLTYVPSTGVLSSTSFTGAGTGLTGTASSLSIGGNATTASTATTANSTTAAVTFNNSGTGAASGTTFNGSTAQTISHNTLGAVALAGSTMTGFLTLSADPTQALHATTKQYVDATSTGLDIKASVRAASTAAFTVTYSNGASGVGATLTNAGAQTAFVTDGITLNVNDRVLIKNQASQFQNGFYIVSNAGSGATNWILTRSTDADTPTKLTPGAFTFIEEGTTQADTGWVMSSTGTTTIGTTNLPFTQFSTAGTITAGNGIVQVGNVFNFAQSSSYTVGDLYYASSATGLTRLAAVATGNALISGGTTTAPAYGKIVIDTTAGVSHVTGTLQVGSGGTGVTTLTGIAYGNGTAAFSAATGAQISTALGSTAITGNSANVTGIVATANGGTGANLTLTQYGVIVANTSTAMISTAAGTALQVLAANTGATPTFQTLNLTYLPDAWVKKSVKAASTANQALSGGVAFPTIDGYATASGDRVLLKNQTTTSANGIYVVGGSAGAWTLTRVSDGNTAQFIAEAAVAVDQGTTQAGKLYRTTFNATNTLDTTAQLWYEVLDGFNFNTYAPTLTGTGASGTWSIAITGNAATATSATSATNATNATNVGTTDDTATNASMYVTWVTANSGNNPIKVTSTKLTFNPSTGILTSTGGFAGTATNATNTAITDDTTTNAVMYPTWVTANSGNLPQKVTSTKLSFNPSTGALTSTSFVGAFSGTATNATNIAITDDLATNATMFPVWVTANTGNLPAKVTSTKITFNPSTGVLTSSAFTTAGATTTASIVYGSNASVTTSAAAVTTTSTTSVDTWSSTTNRSARYTVQIVDGTSYETADILIIHDGTTAYVTTFGNVFTSANSLGSFDATITGGVVTVTYTAVTATSKTVKFTRQLLTV
jgi:hypothetical protein